MTAENDVNALRQRRPHIRSLRISQPLGWMMDEGDTQVRIKLVEGLQLSAERPTPDPQLRMVVIVLTEQR